MDELQPYELELLLDNIDHADRTSWEQTRLQMYITAQVNSRKRLKATDIISLPWDNDKSTDTTISEEDKARLRARSNDLMKKIQNAK